MMIAVMASWIAAIGSGPPGGPTNDIGIITLPDGRHVAMAVFVSESRADETAREGVIAAMTRAVWRCHAERPR